MYIARLLYPVEVLGPGRRVGIWFAGCPQRCLNCSNPELWQADPKHKTTVETVHQLILKATASQLVDGFTISGGEPFSQQKELAQLLSQLKHISEDILVYTGFLRQDLPENVLDNIAVLIDGPYLEERNTGCPLRGSDNQKIHYLKKHYRERYELYLANHRGYIQNFTTQDGVVSVGIHKPGFRF